MSDWTAPPEDDDARQVWANDTYGAIIEALQKDPMPLIYHAVSEWARLGAKLEWDMDDNRFCTEGLVRLADHYDLPSAGDQSDEDQAFWECIDEEVLG